VHPSLPIDQKISEWLTTPLEGGWKGEPGRYSSLSVKTAQRGEMAMTANHTAVSCLHAAIGDYCH